MSRSFQPLNSIQLSSRLLKRHGTHSLGVFALDKLPANPPSDGGGYYCFIVNTDPAYLPGAHWLAVYVDTVKQHAQVFDSYGQPPPVPLQHWLLSHARHWTYTKRFIQGPLSALCGVYCLFVLDMKCTTPYSFDAIVHSMFSEVSTRNDSAMLHYFYTCRKNTV